MPCETIKIGLLGKRACHKDICNNNNNNNIISDGSMAYQGTSFTFLYYIKLFYCNVTVFKLSHLHSPRSANHQINLKR